jgi:hypothetical protein
VEGSVLGGTFLIAFLTLLILYLLLGRKGARATSSAWAPALARKPLDQHRGSRSIVNHRSIMNHRVGFRAGIEPAQDFNRVRRPP